MEFLSFFFPRRCVGCRDVGSYLCPTCVNFFVPMQELYCPECRKMSPYGLTHPRCKKRDSIDGIISGYPYSGLMVKAISKFKYSFVSDLTRTLIELMISGINHPLLYRNSWCLMPVPLHPTRLRWRGFNQAELLTTGLAKSWHMPFQTQVLRRTKVTEPQMKLSGLKRKWNLRGAFDISPDETVPTQVLLVDDVATTCSTLMECAGVLKRAGVKQVWGLTLAQKIPG